ncbi:hypothetical protein D3C84_1246170 [compost metagenome]
METSIRVDPLRIVVEEKHHAVLNIDLHQSFGKLGQVAGTREGVSFFDVDESEKVFDILP